MSDRNSSPSYLPRENARYAELSDLLGDLETDLPVSKASPAADYKQTTSLADALADVDANFTPKPREILISPSGAAADWQPNTSIFTRATPVAAPLAPQVLDAWDLRPTFDAAPPVEPDASEYAVSADEVVALADEMPAFDDDDAFQSAMEGLEGDILADAEIAEFSDGDEITDYEVAASVEAAEVESVAVVEPVIEPEVSNAAPVEPAAQFEDFFSDAIFEDIEIAPSKAEAAPAIEFPQEVFSASDNDLAGSEPVTSEAAQSEFEPEPEPNAGLPNTAAIAATAVAGGSLAAILGSMRANPSREVHVEKSNLPTTALPSEVTQSANSEPLFPEISAPYDDVPVTGSLRVPDFAVPETKMPERAPEFDDFELPDFELAPQTSAVPALAVQASSANPHEVVVHSRRDAAANTESLEEFADLDFSDAFDQTMSPTDELAELVGSNVEADPLMPKAKEADFVPMPPMPPIIAKRSGKGKWVAFGALAVAAIGAVAVYGSSGNVVDDSAEPAIVRADVEPVRVVPENPGGTVVPNQDRVVFNEVAGSAATPEQPQETLVDGRQEPTIAAATPKEEDRVLNGDTTAEPDAAGTAIAPRAVQTVTVRPDGTLVANPPAEQAAATPQAEVVPETRPEAVAEAVAETPGDSAAAQPLPEATEPVEATDPLAEIAAAPVAELPAVETTVAEGVGQDTVAAKVPAKAVKTKPVAQTAKPVQPVETALEAVPSRPSDQPVNIVNGDAPAAAEQQVAAVEPAQEQATQVPEGSYAIQIASQPSEEAATSSLRSLSAKYGSVLGGKDYAIQRAEVPGKGTFYRVRILAGSKADAGKLCARYKSAGGSCFVTR